MPNWVTDTPHNVEQSSTQAVQRPQPSTISQGRFGAEGSMTYSPQRPTLNLSLGSTRPAHISSGTDHSPIILSADTPSPEELPSIDELPPNNRAEESTMNGPSRPAVPKAQTSRPGLLNNAAARDTQQPITVQPQQIDPATVHQAGARSSPTIGSAATSSPVIQQPANDNPVGLGLSHNRRSSNADQAHVYRVLTKDGQFVPLTASPEYLQTVVCRLQQPSGATQDVNALRIIQECSSSLDLAALTRCQRDFSFLQHIALTVWRQPGSSRSRQGSLAQQAQLIEATKVLSAPNLSRGLSNGSSGHTNSPYGGPSRLPQLPTIPHGTPTMSANGSLPGTPLVPPEIPNAPASQVDSSVIKSLLQQFDAELTEASNTSVAQWHKLKASTFQTIHKVLAVYADSSKSESLSAAAEISQLRSKLAEEQNMLARLNNAIVSLTQATSKDRIEADSAKTHQNELNKQVAMLKLSVAEKEKERDRERARADTAQKTQVHLEKAISQLQGDLDARSATHANAMASAKLAFDQEVRSGSTIKNQKGSLETEKRLLEGRMHKLLEEVEVYKRKTESGSGSESSASSMLDKILHRGHQVMELVGMEPQSALQADAAIQQRGELFLSDLETLAGLAVKCKDAASVREALDKMKVWAKVLQKRIGAEIERPVQDAPESDQNLSEVEQVIRLLSSMPDAFKAIRDKAYQAADKKGVLLAEAEQKLVQKEEEIKQIRSAHEAKIDEFAQAIAAQRDQEDGLKQDLENDRAEQLEKVVKQLKLDIEVERQKTRSAENQLTDAMGTQHQQRVSVTQLEAELSALKAEKGRWKKAERHSPSVSVEATGPVFKPDPASSTQSSVASDSSASQKRPAQSPLFMSRDINDESKSPSQSQATSQGRYATTPASVKPESIAVESPETQPSPTVVTASRKRRRIAAEEGSPARPGPSATGGNIRGSATPSRTRPVSRAYVDKHLNTIIMNRKPDGLRCMLCFVERKKEHTESGRRTFTLAQLPPFPIDKPREELIDHAWEHQETLRRLKDKRIREGKEKATSPPPADEAIVVN
ncbi:hypothetical protein IAU60_005162 [Kwoniella sp. DSM 27419]